MATGPDMDAATENAFKQMLGIKQDKPIPSEVLRMWRVAVAQAHRWMSGGPLPAPVLQMIALLHTLGVRMVGAPPTKVVPEEEVKSGG